MIATMNDIFSICVNLLGPEPNGWHSADNIFKFENVVSKISAIVFRPPTVFIQFEWEWGNLRNAKLPEVPSAVVR